MLCPVMRFNLIASVQKFARMAKILRAEHMHFNGSDKEIAQSGISVLEELAIDVGLPMRLRDLNIPEDAIPRLSEGVMKVTRLLANNPRKVTLEDANRIYREAY
jgi:alcohol dehydrogenase class IV